MISEHFDPIPDGWGYNEYDGAPYIFRDDLGEHGLIAWQDEGEDGFYYLPGAGPNWAGWGPHGRLASAVRVAETGQFPPPPPDEHEWPAELDGGHCTKCGLPYGEWSSDPDYDLRSCPGGAT